MIYLASYKGKRRPYKHSLKAFYNSFQDSLIRLLTKGKYSHCEIAILRADGKYDCYSSSIRDGGVRYKVMSLSVDRWDLQLIDNVKVQSVINQYAQTKHHSYDTLGVLGILLPLPQSDNKSFCSEWCYNLIFNSKNGWRFSPNDLASVISDLTCVKSVKSS